ncbi:hypothetical protein [Thermosulfurimonas sp. F29]|uniref:hypothetical protein n=1 Tax=Thermosulfurimonas sp. F29 TaxID=2867247 RepID=UPI001C83CE3E|nr:hypothetical protein [Thermosulfurimonas sp. F29]MBX6421977.1 hypothetical protein [Thermosulfurimonas sp. F29]
MKGKLMLCLLISSLLGWGSTVLAGSIPFTKQGLQALGTSVSEPSLKELRGGYQGFYFEVIFSGFWDSTGQQWAEIKVNTGMARDSARIIAGNESPERGSLSNEVAASPGTSSIQTKAVLGNFKGGSGIFQINQVPGSGNIVRNHLTINIAIFNNQEIVRRSLNNLFRILPSSL